MGWGVSQPLSISEKRKVSLYVYSTTISVKRNASTIQTTCHLPMDLKIFNIYINICWVIALSEQVDAVWCHFSSKPSPCASLKHPGHLHLQSALQTSAPASVASSLNPACFDGLMACVVLRKAPSSSIVSFRAQTAGCFCGVFVYPGMSLECLMQKQQNIRGQIAESQQHDKCCTVLRPFRSWTCLAAPVSLTNLKHKRS